MGNELIQDSPVERRKIHISISMDESEIRPMLALAIEQELTGKSICPSRSLLRSVSSCPMPKGVQLTCLL